MAIRCLARLAPHGATEQILEILRAARDATRVIACCQALGEVADPRAAPELSKLLTARRVFYRRSSWDPGVRKAAAAGAGPSSMRRKPRTFWLASPKIAIRP